jgi:outer membrane protein OmpA-like peptidoglycan-associated protein
MKYIGFLRHLICAGLATGLLFKGSPVQAVETGDAHPWNISLSAGRIDMEGDFPTKDGFLTTLRVGYDYSDWWSFEGGLLLCPVLKAQHYNGMRPDGTFGWINRLEEQAGVGETWTAGLTGDALFHPTPWKRVDPYLTLGIGGLYLGNKMKDYEQFDATLRGGAGVIYNINDEWSVRGDFRASLAGISDKGTVNSWLEAGIRYVFGAHVAPQFSVAGGPKDSDADGLSDEEEARLGTDPFSADTDKDGLSDYDEVRVYKTDPLNPDSDYDGLKDGPEVFYYHTKPLVRDTDGGGVADGHEVIEDGTDPLNPNDDLQLVELRVQFDYNDTKIKPEYEKELDTLAKTLKRDAGSTARIEGHADRLKDSVKEYNQILSEKRAKACVDYLVAKGGIESARLTAVGYGFSRPRAENDKINGNPLNRRTEVYIRKAEQQPGPAEPVKPVELPPAKGPAKAAEAAPDAGSAK